MTDQFPAASVFITCGRDYRLSYGYEYVIMARVDDDDAVLLDRSGGFKTNAAAKRAGLRAAEKFCAPVLEF